MTQLPSESGKLMPASLALSDSSAPAILACERDRLNRRQITLLGASHDYCRQIPMTLTLAKPNELVLTQSHCRYKRVWTDW